VTEPKETTMFWDLVQHSEIQQSRDRTKHVEHRTLTLEKRVVLLEDDLRSTQDLLIKLVQRLEEHFGEDLDGDGGVGSVARPGGTDQ
jgi:hypothetical protein